MSFLTEAFYRRPLEPKSLVWIRIVSSIIMIFALIAYLVHLILLIIHDEPMIQILTEGILNEIETPDIEICVEGTTWEATFCEVQYLNFTVQRVENCWNKYFRSGKERAGPQCYIYESHGDYRMTAGDSSNPLAIRRLDFYWNVGSIDNLTRSSILHPSVDIKLFHSSFNTWSEDEIGDSEKEKHYLDSISLGISRSTSLVNFSTELYFYQELYRAMKKGDAATLLGLDPEYIEIITLPTTQLMWPLNRGSLVESRRIPSESYLGHFSVQLSRGHIEVKEEVRTHTILASAALVGGCYGLLTTLYIILFGMSRLSPWGLIHHVPTVFSKAIHKKSPDDNDSITEDKPVAIVEHPSKKNLSKNEYLPWFFRSQHESEVGIYKDMITRVKAGEKVGLEGNTGSQITISSEPLSIRSITPVDSIEISSVPPNNVYPTAILKEILKKQKEEDERSAKLARRVKELEAILGDYFIDTLYLDEIRTKDQLDKSRSKERRK
ncbi:hypothetical protein BDB01DRAFT_778134 [Pilobolus umbonatus]|nr:hypothetical protein BDB01DRAFT_778134 [Pilobolus umbonatus]